MAKYSYEFKKKVVAAYLNGEGGYEYLCKKYGVKAHGNLERWVTAYKQFGDEGLMRSRKKQNYSLQFKLTVVESYLKEARRLRLEEEALLKTRRELSTASEDNSN